MANTSCPAISHRLTLVPNGAPAIVIEPRTTVAPVLQETPNAVSSTEGPDGVGVEDGVGAGVEVGVALGAGVAVGVDVALGAGLGVDVGVGLGVEVDIALGAGLGVDVGAGLGVEVEVGLGAGVGVEVEVGLGVGVGVEVDVALGTGLGVEVDVALGAGFGVEVEVGLWAGVGVEVDVALGTGLGVDVDVALGAGVGVEVDVALGTGLGVEVDVALGAGVGVEVDVALGAGVGDGGTIVAVGPSGTPQTVTPELDLTTMDSDVRGRPMISGAGFTPSDPPSARMAIDCVWAASAGGKAIWNGMGWRLPSAKKVLVANTSAPLTIEMSILVPNRAPSIVIEPRTTVAPVTHETPKAVTTIELV